MIATALRRLEADHGFPEPFRGTVARRKVDAKLPGVVGVGSGSSARVDPWIEMTMLNVLYFARLRESLGRDAEKIELPAGVADVAGLTAWLRARGEAWERELAPGRSWRVAVNQDMARPESPVRDGDEVAFFPPVTGG